MKKMYGIMAARILSGLLVIGMAFALAGCGTAPQAGGAPTPYDPKLQFLEQAQITIIS
ncbi:MAG: hypothetical protein LBC60_10745 [Spirochaetaceae bacterium]|jgi:starvation-inducible outer membrane lipoprotein|nr:hypothetical protein [Spirochaetaceae bacterium]